MTRFGVLISGSGTNLQAVINAIDTGLFEAEIPIVISSRQDAYGLVRAEKAGIPTLALTPDTYSNPWTADDLIVKTLTKANVDYVILAGYMRKALPPILSTFENRVINLHPSLLPAFPGANGVRDALEYGVKVTGVTVHFAVEQYDVGPIIAQQAVTIFEDDTLESLTNRIHEVEHELLPHVLKLFTEQRVHLDKNGIVRIL
ncbi:MAG: phosphoribosylglycinamide formyltransferase [Coriobacteriia bacterium]|nr:phosphoribosylglycinamide formyltransferase [Coriobacteriia bacterium]